MVYFRDFGQQSEMFDFRDFKDEQWMSLKNLDQSQPFQNNGIKSSRSSKVLHNSIRNGLDH